MLREVFDFVWPCIRLTDRDAVARIRKSLDEERTQHLARLDKWNGYAGTFPNHQLLLHEAEQTASSEIHRKDVIEGKGSTLISTASILVALVSVILALESTRLPRYMAITILTLMALGILYMLAAIYYGVRVSRTDPIFYDSCEDVEERLKSSIEDEPHAAAEKFANTEMNFELILLKSNHLAAGQRFLLRGLVLLGLGVFISIFFQLLFN